MAPFIMVVVVNLAGREQLMTVVSVSFVLLSKLLSLWDKKLFSKPFFCVDCFGKCSCLQMAYQY